MSIRPWAWPTLPFAAWREAPGGTLLLHSVLLWLLAGNVMLPDFNASLRVFAAKGSEDADALGAVRAPSSTQPLALKNTDNKTVAGVVNFLMKGPVAAGAAKCQRGFIVGRNFCSNIVDLDCRARVVSMQPDVMTSMPALLALDFEAAFPS